MPRRYRYTGILTKPMPVPEPKNALVVGSPINTDKVRVEYQRRIDALMMDCGVDPASRDCWIDLALALAERHVRAFSFESRHRNSVRGIKDRTNMRIYLEMVKLRDKDISQRSAARIVAGKMNRKRDGQRKLTDKAVDTIYRRLKKDLDD